MEETKKIRNQRYTEGEANLIKNTFAENEDIVKALQKAFLQLPLNAMELSTLSLNIKGEMIGILRKTFLPKLTDDVPPWNVYDMWQTIKIEGKMWDDVVMGIRSNQVIIDYLEQQLKVLESGDYSAKQAIVFNELTDLQDRTGKAFDQEVYTDVMARNSIIVIVQGALAKLYSEAGKKETDAEREERLEKDSSK